MDITVETKNISDTKGKLKIGSYIFDCTLGKNGLIDENKKMEGDKKTPIGTYPLRYMLYRADRNKKPYTSLNIKEITPETGWCEDSKHRDYNKEVKLPHSAVSDKMMRDDHLYDYTIILGHNDNPPAKDRGSAIFIHLARNKFTPTDGCIGLKKEDMLQVLKLCGGDTKIKIKIPGSQSIIKKTLAFIFYLFARKFLPAS